MEDAQAKRNAACKAYVAAKLDGKSNKEATALANKAGKAGHSLLDLSWYFASKQSEPLEGYFPHSVTEGDTANAIVQLQGGAGWNGKYEGRRLSWGHISIALGWFDPNNPSTSGENEVQRLFPHATKVVAGEAIAAEGLRSGKGGRWLKDDPRLYQGNHKGNGVEDEKPRQVDPATLNDDDPSKVVAFATGKKAAAKRTRKPRTPAKPKA